MCRLSNAFFFSQVALRPKCHPAAVCYLTFNDAAFSFCSYCMLKSLSLDANRLSLVDCLSADTLKLVGGGEGARRTKTRLGLICLWPTFKRSLLGLTVLFFFSSTATATVRTVGNRVRDAFDVVFSTPGGTPRFGAVLFGCTRRRQRERKKRETSPADELRRFIKRELAETDVCVCVGESNAPAHNGANNGDQGQRRRTEFRTGFRKSETEKERERARLASMLVCVLLGVCVCFLAAEARP